MSNRIRTLKAQHAAVLAAMVALNKLCDQEDRDPTAEEQAAYDANKAKAAELKASIERAEQRASDVAGAVALVVRDNAQLTGGQPLVLEDPKRGFKHLGDYAASVKNHYRSHGQATDDRLTIIAAAPTTFGDEASGGDGGFAVPPEFSGKVWRYAISEDSLIPWCDDTPVTGNGMVFPKDETVPWGTDGIRAFWQAEATLATQTKPALGALTMRLHKLLALVPMTDELLADTDALNSYLPEKAGLSIRWKANESILFGNGNGQPLGCLTPNATGIVPALTIAKDAGQATLTLSETNIANMKRSHPPGSYRRSLWLVNNDVEAALVTLKTAGSFPLPIYIPFGGGVPSIQAEIQGDGGSDDDEEPDGRLYGRPVYLSQHANTFSSLGDVMNVNLSYYHIITKAGEGIETATSMHLYFDADAMAFRWMFRMDGQPKISKPISPAKGSNKMSPFLQLQAR